MKLAGEIRKDPTPYSVKNGAVVFRKEKRSTGLFAAEQGFQLWKDRIPVQYGKMDLILQQSASLHSEPDSPRKLGASLSAQSLAADARKGDWYRVETWLGKAWVHVARPILGKVEPKDTALTLTRNTKLYREPSEGGAPAGELAPQKWPLSSSGGVGTAFIAGSAMSGFAVMKGAPHS